MQTPAVKGLTFINSDSISEEAQTESASRREQTVIQEKSREKSCVSRRTVSRRSHAHKWEGLRVRVCSPLSPLSPLLSLELEGERMASALVSVTWLRQQMANGLKNIRILDGKQ